MGRGIRRAPVRVDPEQAFPLIRARAIVGNLRTRKPRVYWVDFLLSVTLGWTAFALALAAPDFSLRQGLCTFVAGLALYRAVIFTHELAHAPLDVFREFRSAWNLLCGFALLVPSFTYRGVHRDHHRRDLYGRREDGEYLPFATEHPYKIALYPMLSLVLPLLFVARFTILTPLSYLHRGVRRFTWQRASSLTIDLTYRRPLPSAEEERIWRRQELAASAYAFAAIVLITTGVVPLQAAVLWYCVAVLVLFVNSLRTLAAHCYRNSGDRTMEIPEQFLDSVDVPGHRLLTALWAPVGLRYHATHHLFPALPYHALAAAHQRLVSELPDNTLYLAATRRSLWDALARLWQEARASRAEPEGRQLSLS